MKAEIDEAKYIVSTAGEWMYLHHDKSNNNEHVYLSKDNKHNRQVTDCLQTT